MKTLLIVVGIILVILIVALILLARQGLFARVAIVEKHCGPYLLVYQKHIGDYKNVAPVMDALYYDLLDHHQIETTRGFGLYYDNPQTTAADQLRSIVGCIVEDKSTAELNHLTEKYGVVEFPASSSVVAEFPYKGKLSIVLGIFKVYPKLNAFIAQHNTVQNPIMEIYDQPNQKIEYVMSTELPAELYESFLETNR